MIFIRIIQLSLIPFVVAILLKDKEKCPGKYKSKSAYDGTNN